jgi:short-subunit dehydrogenase
MRGIAISGASRGLGAALARRFAAPGVRLLLLARGEAPLSTVVAECRARGAEAEAVPLDIRDAPGVAAALARFGAVDTVIANAGVSGGTRPDGSPEGHASAIRQVEVNLIGAMNLVEPVLPAMLASGRGRIAFVASVAAFCGLPDSPAYSASKAGMLAWAEALRAAHGPRGLRVTVACPGFFASAMQARFQGPKPFAMELETVAARIHRGVERGASRLFFPAPLAAALRLLPLLPAPLADRAVRLMRFRVEPE